jgi:hypothetical protein
MSGLLDSAFMRLLAGGVLCAGAVALLWVAAGGIFASQLALAASMAGQALLAAGLLSGRWDGAGGWLAVAAVETVLVFAAPSSAHRALCTLGAASALLLAAVAAGASTLYPAVLAVAFVAAQGASPRRLLQDALWSPISTGLGLALLLAIPFGFVESLLSPMHRATVVVAPWLGTLLIVGVFVVAIVRLLGEAGVRPASRTGATAVAAGVLVALAAWPVPGVVVALIVLLHAFAAGRRTLAGLAVLALLAALAHYYYALQSPLLVKAGALALTAIVLLGARIALHVLARAPGAPDA